jgi:hypothetical protein
MKRNLIAGGLVGAVAVALLAAPAQARVSASQKGSLLIYSKVEIRWDYTGNLIQDTFIDITNDFPGDVCVQMYFIQGDEYLPANYGTTGERSHPGCNWVDVGICLTQNQPTYWSAATGYAGPDGDPVSPFTILDPGNPPGRPDYVAGSSDRILRGYIIAWAVDNLGREIRWNHLKGDAVIVNYLQGTAWEYTAWAFASRVGGLAGPNGALHPTPGVLNMNDIDDDGADAADEYEASFALLLLDFYSVGSSAFSSNGYTASVDTDLTLHPVSVDLTQEGDGEITTKASFTVWNQNESKFTGLDRCITCWDQTLLSEYGIPNHFFEFNLGTDKGKAQIDGLESQLCDLDYEEDDICTQNALAGGANSGADEDCDPRDIESVAASLLGVVAKHLTFNTGDYAVAGMNLIGMGTEAAVITADLQGTPPPERPDNGVTTPTRFPLGSAK